jgi:hypothetical protein
MERQPQAPYSSPVLTLLDLTSHFHQDKTHLLRAEDHFVFSSSSSQFVSIDKIYREKECSPANHVRSVRLEARKETPSTHATGFKCVILLPQPPKCWDYSCTISCLASLFLLKGLYGQDPSLLPTFSQDSCIAPWHTYWQCSAYS